VSWVKMAASVVSTIAASRAVSASAHRRAVMSV
jgi:hypothetical protein